MTRRTIGSRAMLRRLCGPFFVFAGTMHFVRPRWYESIMPPYVPRHRELVYATLAADFPANVHMAVNHSDYPVPGGRPALLARLPFQLVFAAWVRAAMRA